MHIAGSDLNLDAFGARPLSRIIQEHVKKPLAEELLFGKLAKGGAVKVAVSDDKLTFELTESKPVKTVKPAKKDPGEEADKAPVLTEK